MRNRKKDVNHLPQWAKRLDFFTLELKKMRDKLDSLEREGVLIFPERKNILRAFKLVHPHKVRVVILGQDPYHGPGQATGLAFAVNKGTPIPPSLRNILNEVRRDMYDSRPIVISPELTQWARQGVLLLNTVLTVEAHSPRSHRYMGWEDLTLQTLAYLSNRKRPPVFLLWGKDAQELAGEVVNKRAKVLTAGHPSPFSVKYFSHCAHFSETNEYLRKTGQEPIVW